MKTNSEKFNVDFVKLVESNSCIWDTKSEGYRNKRLVKATWDQISKEINEPAENLPERWRKIRDALFRSIKRHSIKKGNRKRKPYYLTSHLHFLLQSSILSTTSKNDESSIFSSNSKHDESYTDDNRVSEYETESEASKPGPFLDESKTNKTTEGFRINADFESIQSLQTNDILCANKNKTHEFQHSDHQYPEMTEKTESILSKRMKLNAEEDENDSDMNFFKSLLRDVRKMNDRQNRKFRLRVLQVIDDMFDDDRTGD